MTPWLDGLPWTPYEYRGTGRDELTAWMDDEPDPPHPGGRPRIQPCGTEAGYRWHVRHGEKPVRDHCPACADANRDGWNERNGGSDSTVHVRRRERYRRARDAGLSVAEAAKRRYGDAAAEGGDERAA